MRKETQKIATAFVNHKKASAARTRTDGQSVYLHDNQIAWWNYGDVKPALCFSMAGWGTVTTRERINGILEASGSNWRLCQRDYAQFIINTRTEKLVPIDQYRSYFAPTNDDDMPERIGV